MKPIAKPLKRHLKSFFGRRDLRHPKHDALYDEQDGNEVIASVESSCIHATKKKLNLFRKAEDIRFERSRAPSPESMRVRCPEEISISSEPTRTTPSANLLHNRVNYLHVNQAIDQLCMTPKAALKSTDSATKLASHKPALNWSHNDQHRC